MVDILEDFFLFYSNLTCANQALVKRVYRYKIAVACYGLQREEDVYDDDEVLEFDEVTEDLRNKCTQEIIRALNTSTERISKTKLETMNNFNQLKKAN